MGMNIETPKIICKIPSVKKTVLELDILKEHYFMVNKFQLYKN